MSINNVLRLVLEQFEAWEDESGNDVDVLVETRSIVDMTWTFNSAESLLEIHDPKFDEPIYYWGMNQD